MKRRISIMLGACALSMGAASVGLPMVAQAKSCPTSSLKAAVTCFNNRVAAQHNQIVSLQKKVAALSKSTTIAGFSARLAAVEQHQNCQNTMRVSEYTTQGNPWGNVFPAGGWPYQGPGTYSWLDLFHSSQPSDQQTFPLVYQAC